MITLLLFAAMFQQINPQAEIVIDPKWLDPSYHAWQFCPPADYKFKGCVRWDGPKLITSEWPPVPDVELSCGHGLTCGVQESDPGMKAWDNNFKPYDVDRITCTVSTDSALYFYQDMNEKKCRKMGGYVVPKQPEPMDVPAKWVKEEENITDPSIKYGSYIYSYLSMLSPGQCPLRSELHPGSIHHREDGTSYCHAVYWSCADKSRFLMTAEDGSKHCMKFQ